MSPPRLTKPSRTPLAQHGHGAVHAVPGGDSAQVQLHVAVAEAHPGGGARVQVERAVQPPPGHATHLGRGWGSVAVLDVPEVHDARQRRVEPAVGDLRPAQRRRQHQGGLRRDGDAVGGREAVRPAHVRVRPEAGHQRLHPPDLADRRVHRRVRVPLVAVHHRQVGDGAHRRYAAAHPGRAAPRQRHRRHHQRPHAQGQEVPPAGKPAPVALVLAHVRGLRRRSSTSGQAAPQSRPSPCAQPPHPPLPGRSAGRSAPKSAKSTAASAIPTISPVIAVLRVRS